MSKSRQLKKRRHEQAIQRHALKRRRRDKELRKKLNILKNQSPPIWSLRVLKDGSWIEAKEFRSISQVERHVEKTENERRAGHTILPGKVVVISTGKVVKEIDGSPGSEVVTPKGPMDAKVESPKAQKMEQNPAAVAAVESKKGSFFKKLFGKGSRHT